VYTDSTFNANVLELSLWCDCTMRTSSGEFRRW